MVTQARAFLEHIQGDYPTAIRKGLSWIGFERLVDAHSRIFIKPNLTYPSYKPGVMTSPAAVEAAVIALREYSPHIYLGDSDSGGYNRFSMDEVYRETGILDFATKHQVSVVNLSRLETKAIPVRCGREEIELQLPRLLTDEIDLLVTMPVPKIHMNTGVSLTFKNQWGCIPEPKDRLRLHPQFKHVILEVNKAVKARVAIVDGAYGLNRSGPLRGRPVELGWILVTDSIGAGARLACELMQVPLRKVEHLQYACDQGWIPALDEIELNTGLHPFLKERFYLRREWTDYPGLLAFRSPFVANLAYFSPLAQLLHRLLYLFREPFYDYERPSKR